MEYAVKDQKRVVPTPGTQATCELCHASVLAKCGKINIWHWAHKNNRDCDPWSEPESEWHRNWKLHVPLDRREVTMANHRADIVGLNGGIVELQHSSITTTEISERESFYKNMIWLIDSKPFAANIRFSKKDNYWTFRWYHSRKHHQLMKRPLFWDIEDYAREKTEEIQEAFNLYKQGVKYEDSGNPGLSALYNTYECNAPLLQERLDMYMYIHNNPIFSVRKLYDKGGWGTFMTKKAFIQKYF